MSACICLCVCLCIWDCTIDSDLSDMQVFLECTSAKIISTNAFVTIYHYIFIA